MDRAKKKIRRVLLYGLIIAVCLLTNLPMLSMLGTAFKPTDEVMANTNLFTTNPSLDNFRKVAEKTSFPHAVVWWWRDFALHLPPWPAWRFRARGASFSGALRCCCSFCR